MATGEEVINYLYGAYIRHLERERLKTKIQIDNERLCNMITCYPRPSDPIEALFEDRDRFYSCKQHPSINREELDVDD